MQGCAEPTRGRCNSQAVSETQDLFFWRVLSPLPFSKQCFMAMGMAVSCSWCTLLNNVENQSLGSEEYFLPQGFLGHLILHKT